MKSTANAHTRMVKMSYWLFVALMAAAALVGFASAALADLRLPSTPIGEPPLIVSQRIVATPIPPPTPRPAVTARPQPRPVSAASSRCGGSLPPCSVMQCESKGDLRVWNGGKPYSRESEGFSSASGKWQITRGSWAGHGGYRNAADAPEHVQDERARQLWADGSHHWRSCL